MILTPAQVAARARVIGYTNVLGAIRCQACGGTMMPETDSDGAGWACLLCPAKRWWNIPDGDGYKHLRPSDMCRKLTDYQAEAVFARFRDGTKIIDICREFKLNRQTVSHLRAQWLQDTA